MKIILKNKKKLKIPKPTPVISFHCSSFVKLPSNKPSSPHQVKGDPKLEPNPTMRKTNNSIC
jgi:hypothetical protein